MAIQVTDISKRYDAAEVLSGLSLTFRDGAVSCLLGPSGSGKTTLLGILAGLIPPDAGSVRGLEGRSLSYAFQEDRLLPWKTVADNVDFVLDRALFPDERARRVDKWLQLVGMEEAAARWPSQLSGGMARRVALARACAPEAGVLLLDEPFSGIDAALKSHIMGNLKKMWAEAGTTVILVTHDVDEALATGDELFMLGGRPLNLLRRQPVTGDLTALRASLLQG